MKKNNRLIFFIASLAALALLVVLIVAVKSCVEKNVIQDFNDSAALPIALGTPETELDDVSAYEKVEGFGCYRLQDDGLSYELSGYPDVLSGYHVTGITVTSGDYEIYGVRVGSAYPEDQLALMKSHGFTPSDGTRASRKFENGKLSVTFQLQENTVVGITVALRTTNITGVQF